MKKKSIIFIVFIAILFCLFTTSNAAEISSGNYTYKELSDGTINLTRYNGNEEHVIVPATIDEKRVKKIDTNTFKENSIVRTISLPEGLEIIDSYVFNSCPNLTNIYMPSTLNLLSGLFYKSCPNIIYTIPDHLTKVINGSYMSIFKVTTIGTYNYDLVNEIFKLVNEERVKEGVEPLQYNLELQKSANIRASEIAIDFDHDRPNSLSCFSLSNSIAGENIAAGATTAKGIMNAWMNSPGHRANILRERFHSIAIGCYQRNGSVYWVQLFSEDGGATEPDRTGKESDVQDIIEINLHANKIKLNISWDDRNIEQTNKIDLNVGEKIAPLKVKLINPNKTSVKTDININDVKWSSSNENVFIVDESGNITAIGEGSAELTAELGDDYKKYEITVNDNATSFSLDHNTYQINSLSERPTLVATLDTGNKAKVTWSSSNEQIAKVDSNGTITPIKGGFVHIKAKSDKFGEKSCWVYVCTLITLSNGNQCYAGDLNRDGMISATDASIILDYYRNGNINQDINYIGDIDGNGSVTSIDASLILDIYKNNTFHAGKYNPIQSIIINENNVKLEIGEKISLISTISPTHPTDSSKITWNSSNTAVATVDDFGNVTLVGKGRAVISATTSNGKKATCIIMHPEFEKLVYTTIPTAKMTEREIMTFKSKTGFETILTSENFPILDVDYKVELYDSLNKIKGNTNNVGSKNTIRIKDIEGNTVAEFTVVVPGDVTGDGYVRMYDSFEILKGAVTGNKELDEIDYLIRDYNKDGNIRMYDAFQYLREAVSGK